MPAIWLIDDDEELARDLICFWCESLGVTAAKFRLFPVAQTAVEQFQNLQSHSKTLPEVVFVDGNLGQDEGRFRSGVEVVKALRAMSATPDLHIIGFSSDPLLSESMRQEGADTAFVKSQFREATAYLRDLLECHPA
jgi:CheY-like chemotaxis protein